MTKEEADQITAVKVELAALTAEIREQNKTLFEITRRHERALSGNHESPGLGTRVALLESFSTRTKAIIAAVGLTILGLIANAVKAFLGAG